MPKTGDQISHYKIISAIGAGGMGEVFLAEDTKLYRKVALKVLPAAVVADGERLRRFEQEARAASALNHPNILTIYEIGEHEAQSYISTEYVHGKTLRDLMRDDVLTLHQAIDIAVQTASALAAAHEAGIIHRDIKPENIMVRPDGLVKVLDFGLAKLTDTRDIDQIDAEGETRAQVNTAPGIIMGTVQYMSPEQTRGKGTDARSDIWSLGCVMYEMFAGRAPFTGDNTADIIAEIVKEYPPPLQQITPEIPERLDEIVSKTLEKQPDERYQSVKDLLIDLRRLKKKLDTDMELDRSHPPGRSGNSDPLHISTRAISAQPSNTITGHATLSGAEAVTSSIKQHKFGAAAVIAIAAIVLTGFGYGLYRFIEKPKADAPRVAADIKTIRLTGDGKTRDSVISPDGKFLLYLRTEADQSSLWIKQIQTNSNIPVVKPGEVERFWGLTFSPDGAFVYFNAGTKDLDTPTVYRAPTLGGTPTRVLSDAYQVQFSRDGSKLSFNRYDPKSNEISVFVANADGSGERKLASKSGRQFFNAAPAWSPDEQYLAVALGNDDLAPDPSLTLTLISVADGSLSELGPRFFQISDVVWHPSGDSLIVVAGDISLSPTQLWEISYPSGTVRRLTNNLNGYGSISITSDGRSIATGEIYSRSAVWVSPDLKPENAKPIMPATADTWGFGWTPDNRIVVSSDQSGDSEIWIMDADGANAKPLTNDRAAKFIPVVSPDGRYIVYSSAAGGGRLERIDITGGNVFPYLKSLGADNPDISLDSKWLLYSAWLDGVSTIFRRPLDGSGEPQQLTDYWATEPRYSHDGTRFACFIRSEKTLAWGKLAVVAADGGAPVKVFDAPINTSYSRGPVWTPDDRGVTMIVSSGEKQNIWVQPLEGGPAKQMTNFNVPGVSRREYSLDGKRFAMVRAEGIGNAIMITGFR